jgi:tripartite-type tricarboxylate transporter receptor subunit TctC
MFLSMSSALKQVQAGKLRALGVASKERSSAAPNLPTVAEQGLPGFEAISWYALVAPAGTSKEIVDKIASDSAKALKAPDVRERLLGLGANPVGNTPAELAAMLKKEYAFWGDFIRKAGIKAE